MRTLVAHWLTILIGLTCIERSAVAQGIPPSQAPADTPAQIGRDLEGAKQAYKAKLDAAKAPLLRWLDEAEDKARDATNINLVERIKWEREQLRGTGAFTIKLPKNDQKKLSIYRDAAAHARDELARAYSVAIGRYLKARDDDAVKKAQAERENLLMGLQLALRIPADAKTFGGNKYKLFEELMTWHEAKQRCEQLGGHLVIANSGQENQFLMATLRASAVKELWIGVTDEANEGQWVCVDGSPMRYDAWDAKAGQPNNRGAGLPEHYGMMLSSGLWWDLPDHAIQGYKPGYVCEWEAGPLAAPRH